MGHNRPTAHGNTNEHRPRSPGRTGQTAEVGDKARRKDEYQAGQHGACRVVQDDVSTHLTSRTAPTARTALADDFADGNALLVVDDTHHDLRDVRCIAPLCDDDPPPVRTSALIRKPACSLETALETFGTSRR